MSYDENLAERIREAIGAQRGLDEIKMFGGLAFTINGNIVCGVMHDEMMVRVATDEWEQLLESPGAHTMDMMPGRPPAKGFVVVGGSAIDTKPKLQKWVARGVAFASSLPPKAKKAAAKKSVKPKKK
jgi:TfoX/Sxy family transcriptional regulator of competence genes